MMTNDNDDNDNDAVMQWLLTDYDVLSF